MTDLGGRIAQALADAGMSQRRLSEATGISQSTLSRVIAGQREPKMPELVAIAWATGHTIPQLTGMGDVAGRVECAARATNGSQMETLRRRLVGYLELDAYLDDQGIVGPA